MSRSAHRYPGRTQEYKVARPSLADVFVELAAVVWWCVYACWPADPKVRKICIVRLEQLGVSVRTWKGGAKTILVG